MAGIAKLYVVVVAGGILLTVAAISLSQMHPSFAWGPDSSTSAYDLQVNAFYVAATALCLGLVSLLVSLVTTVVLCRVALCSRYYSELPDVDDP